LYYCSKNLYKIRTDGTGRQKLNDDRCTDINVAGDWVYYCNMNDNNKLNSKFLEVANSILQISGKLFRIRTDGTGRQKLSDDWCSNIVVAGDWVYYTSMKDNLKGYRIRTDGTDRQLVE
jgi:meiotically up-regulated gene 157 (Mug157) protein